MWMPGLQGQQTGMLCVGPPMFSYAPGWPKDCSELPASSPSGIYLHHPMIREDGGWTVIQRNHRDTPASWDESWSTYKHSFGNVHTEFWLGTKYIHQITRQKVYEARFVIWDASNNMKFADYNLFSLGDESQGYQLRLGAHSGTAEDAMACKGTTTMHDNMNSGGGWWYLACYSVLLNIKGGMTWGSLCPRGTAEPQPYSSSPPPTASCIFISFLSNLGLILGLQRIGTKQNQTGCATVSVQKLVICSY
uniref:Fibrinogen C-terminal domain-containing protein n=1 Tax=Cyanoderma ruficeps TaxID=181631 RepID=A0A8C3QV26_9PASS